MKAQRTTFGVLEPVQLEAILRENTVGRVGCYTGDRPYIVPVNYAYDGTCVYGYTADGMKLRCMRKNPLICFEVDEVESASDWRSVIAWGRFEELEGHEAVAALELLSARLQVASDEALDAARTFVTRRGRYGLAYRLHLFEKSGRFERNS